MPNYCYNVLFFIEKEGRAALKELMGDAVFDFNKIAPYPEVYAQRDLERAAVDSQSALGVFIAKYGNAKDGYNSGGYEWCCKNWGIKWNTIKPRHIEDTVVFDTAWGPPLAIYEKLSQLLTPHGFYYEYYEKSMCGGGFYSNGEVSEVWEARYRGFRGG